MKAEQERGLVDEARRDSRAFRQLYASYFPRLYAYISYRVGRAQDAEDLTAETFMRVVEGLHSFEWRHDNSFAAWLFRIAHNLVSNHRRDGGHSAEPIPIEDLPHIPAGAMLPDDLVMRKEAFLQLHEMVNALPKRRREVITLKFFTGLSNREIAQVLGRNERTVASNLCRALDDLQEKYALAGEPGKRKRYERAK